MKLFYLFIICLLFPSCYRGSYTYINQMHNEPAFTKTGELRGHAAMGLKHFEALGAVSVSKHIGLHGSMYTAGTRRISGEAGINLFASVNNNKYVSLAAGFSNGFIIGKYNWELSKLEGGGKAEIRTDSRFNGFYLQPSYYQFIDPEKRSKFSLGTKISLVKFSHYDNTVLITPEKNPFFIVKYRGTPKMTLFAPFMQFNRVSEDGAFELTVLTGFNVIKGFSPDKIEMPDNYPDQTLVTPYTLRDKPYLNNRVGYSLIFFNISLGIRLDLLQ